MIPSAKDLTDEAKKLTQFLANHILPIQRAIHKPLKYNKNKKWIDSCIKPQKNEIACVRTCHHEAGFFQQPGHP